MADLQKPAVPKRALPFKRTARPAQASASLIDDDGLSLFSQSKTYFDTVVEEQKRRAREKAELAEKERLAKLARQKEEEQEARETKLRAKRETAEAEAAKEAAKKRRRSSTIISDDEDTKDVMILDDDDDPFIDEPQRKSRKSSTPYSPEVTHVTRGMSQASNKSSPRRSLRKAGTPVVLLDSSEDEDPKLGASYPKIRSSGSRTDTSRLVSETDHVKDEDGDSDIEILHDKTGNDDQKDTDDEDPAAFYIRQALEERMRKEEMARKAREARESSAAGDRGNDGVFLSDVKDEPTPLVSVMIVAPGLPEAKPICCTVRTTQALDIVFQTFKQRLKTQTKYPHQVISGLYFTWRGDRVYDTTKLETLGIYPRGRDGRLHDGVSGGRKAPEGFVGKDKVYFEACTPEEFAENQAKRERLRKRREMGEWWDEEEEREQHESVETAEAEAPRKQEERVRVIFKAKDMQPRNITMRKFHTVTHMIRGFRKLTQLAEDKHIEIRWDGEVLDPDTTLEEADIQDMDSVEVHIR
ncbi:hypothetical protein F5Y17DRAFT_422313 [Xylariaceae sp. FL0594]|nr:hypothetical protein F5Y17DRAFT_422313 [Xylariaceae sp. FL0594]